MTATGTDALKERIARDLWDHDNLHMSAAWRDMAWDDMGGSEPTDERIAYILRAAAVLPIVAAEVRKAKAEALREAADSVHDNAASPYCLPCHRDDAGLLHTIAAEYETGDSDERR